MPDTIHNANAKRGQPKMPPEGCNRFSVFPRSTPECLAPKSLRRAVPGIFPEPNGIGNNFRASMKANVSWDQRRPAHAQPFIPNCFASKK